MPEKEIVYVREVAIRYRGPRLSAAPVAEPKQAVAFARKVVTDDAREHFVAIYLDGRHRPIAYSVVGVGTASAALVHPREVFQAAVIAGAVGVIILHNHPSGDPNPSREDFELSERLKKAGELLGISVLDSLVWTTDGTFVSISTYQSGLLASP